MRVRGIYMLKSKLPTAPQGAEQSVWTSAVITYALGFMVVCTVVYLLTVSAAITIPFVIAVCVWYLINALARGLSRLRPAGWQMPRWTCLLVAILFLAGALWSVMDLISRSAAEVVREAPHYQANLERMLPRILALLGLSEEAVKAQDIREYFNLTLIITTLAKTFSGIAGKAMVVTFYTGFLLYEQKFFNRKIIEMIEDRDTEHNVRRILHNIDISIQHYVWVKALISVLTGGLVYLFLLHSGVNFSKFWGLMAFVLNFIPYIGSLLAVVLPSMIALIQFGDVSMFLSVLLGLSVIQIAFGGVVEPRLMGRTLNLSPIMIIFSLGAGWMIWRVPGLFLAVPILVMITITLSQFAHTRPLAVLMTKTGRLDLLDDKSPLPPAEGEDDQPPRKHKRAAIAGKSLRKGKKGGKA